MTPCHCFQVHIRLNFILLIIVYWKPQLLQFQQNVTTADRDVSIHWLTLLPDTYTVPGLCIWQSNYMYFNQSSVIWEFSIFWQLLCVTTVVVLTTACRVCTGGRHLFPNEKKGICWVWNWASAGENSSRNID